MNGSKELNAEEMLRRMEQMAEEMDRNERKISSLEADKEELLAEVGQQKRQISQLIDYAEALNRENRRRRCRRSRSFAWKGNRSRWRKRYMNAGMIV